MSESRELKSKVFSKLLGVRCAIIANGLFVNPEVVSKWDFMSLGLEGMVRVLGSIPGFVLGVPWY